MPGHQSLPPAGLTPRLARRAPGDPWQQVGSCTSVERVRPRDEGVAKLYPLRPPDRREGSKLGPLPRSAGGCRYSKEFSSQLSIISLYVYAHLLSIARTARAIVRQQGCSPRTPSGGGCAHASTGPWHGAPLDTWAPSGIRTPLLGLPGYKTVCPRPLHWGLQELGLLWRCRAAGIWEHPRALRREGHERGDRDTWGRGGAYNVSGSPWAGREEPRLAGHFIP